MKQALKVIEEIKRMELGCANSRSPYLRKDYEKNIAKLKKELKEYCHYKNLNYNALIKTL